MLHRIYIGTRGKMDLMYHTGELLHGQRIRVTPEEAEWMDRQPTNWAIPPAIAEPSVWVNTEKQETPQVEVIKKKRKGRRK